MDDLHTSEDTFYPCIRHKAILWDTLLASSSPGQRRAWWPSIFPLLGLEMAWTAGRGKCQVALFEDQNYEFWVLYFPDKTLGKQEQKGDTDKRAPHRRNQIIPAPSPWLNSQSRFLKFPNLNQLCKSWRYQWKDLMNTFESERGQWRIITKVKSEPLTMT